MGDSDVPGSRSPLRTVLQAVLLGVAYIAAVRIATAISTPNVSIAPIRLPNAIVITALLLTPPSTWWIYLLAIVPAHFRLPNLPVGLLYLAANWVEIVIAAEAVRRVARGRPKLEGLQECLTFIIVAVLVAPAIGGFIGALAVQRLYPTVAFADAWRTWGFGEAVGNVALVPALLALAAFRRRTGRGVRGARVGEAVILAALIIAASLPTLGIFGAAGATNATAFSMLYVPFPLLVWAGLRFGAAGAAGSTLLLAALSVLSALLGRGPFARPDNPSGVLIVQQLLVVAGATAVTLAGVAEERRRTIAALRLSEEKFQRAFHASPDAIAISSISDGQFIEVNEGFERLLEFPRRAVIGTTSMALGIWETQAERDSMVQAVREGRCHSRFTRLRARSGQVKFVLFSAARLDIDGRECAVSVIRDITERRQVEEALRDSESRYRSLFDTATDVVVTTDLHGNMETANAAFELTTGWARADWFGRPVTAFLDPDEVQGAEQRMQAVVQGGASTPQAWRLRTRAGEWRVAEVKGSLFTHAGRAAGLLLIARDITDRERAEAERAHLENEIAQSRKLEAVGQLAGGIAHDFNNLLQAILGFAEITRGHLPPGSRGLASLDKVVQAGERARDLTQQLLTFSRREMINPKLLDLTEAVNETSHILRRVLPANVTLHLSSEDATPALVADRGHINQIVMNLCVNARDAMPEGGSISVAVGHRRLDAAFASAHPWAREGEFVVIGVGDTGEGIPPEFLPRIFEPFFTTKDVGRGTGLGLATVYAIVKRYDGLIDVDTALGRGTTVTVYLPARSGENAAEASGATASSPGGGGELILVAEDEPDVRELAVLQLENAGYRVVAACDGAEALRLFSAHEDEIRLVFLDIMMPNGDGRDVRRALAARRPDLPVLFATGYGDRDGLGRRREAIADPVIEKPYTPSALLGKVRELIDKRAPR